MPFTMDPFLGDLDLLLHNVPAPHDTLHNSPFPPLNLSQIIVLLIYLFYLIVCRSNRYDSIFEQKVTPTINSRAGINSNRFMSTFD